MWWWVDCSIILLAIVLDMMWMEEGDAGADTQLTERQNIDIRTKDLKHAGVKRSFGSLFGIVLLGIRISCYSKPTNTHQPFTKQKGNPIT